MRLACARVPGKSRVDKMASLRERRTDRAGRIARSHFRMNEQVGRLLFPAVRIGARRFISAGGGALEPFERRKVAAPGHILQANLP